MNKKIIAAGAVICTVVGVVTTVTVTGQTGVSPDSLAPIVADAMNADSLAGTSFAAGMHFTDNQGNPRSPTAEERAAIAAAFQADIARLTAAHGMPDSIRHEPSGAISAVVGASKLRYLVVNVDDNAEVTFSHSDMDENGVIEPVPVNELPEM